MSDRKYRQSGYQDSKGDAKRGDDRESRREGGPKPPQERGEAPRGRGMGSPTEEVFRCARCGEAQPVAGAMALDAKCGQCGTDLHTCTHCVSFDTGSAFECRKPIPKRVSPKDRANRCELYDPRLSQEFAREKTRGPADAPSDARAAFDALFKF